MRFTKMQGVGNDFVVVDASELPSDIDYSRVAIETCHRHFGIGADGLLVVSPTPNSETAFRMRMFNPDGTEDMCGNGLRCVGLWAARAGWLGNATEFLVATKEGSRRMRLLEINEDKRSGMLEVDMGVPQFSAELVPFYNAKLERIIDFPLFVDDRAFLITTMNTGSTHTVIFGTMPSEEAFQHYSPLIENHKLFPERTSILWATASKDNSIDIRIWERGAGETLGCGTGAAAVGVSARLHGLVDPKLPIHVKSKGGTLEIQWAGRNASIDMVGPAAVAFEGEITLACT